MALTIGELLEGRDRPLSVRTTDTLVHAIETMARHDYTQLPVTSEEDKLVGVVTSDSILRATDALGLAPAKLKVADAMTRPKSFDPDADVGDLLNALRDHYAAIVVDGEHKLVGIITGYDASEYFRRRSEDIMLVEDIETCIKDHIRSAYQASDGKIDECKIADAISVIAQHSRQVRGPVNKAVRLYLSRAATGPGIDQVALDRAIDESLEPVKKSFDDLSLSQYIDLLLYAPIWSGYADVFGIEAEALRRLLSGVREIRNALAHFRGEISATQRATLRYCAEWLERHAPRRTVVAPAITVVSQPPAESAPDDIIPVDDEIEPGEGRYAKLALWLERADPSQEDMSLTFNQIEEVIGGGLPVSAREHRSWWANDRISHPQSRKWLDAGWRVSEISLPDETVTFSRTEERESAYITFFSELDRKLAVVEGFPFRPSPIRGLNWHTVARVPLDQYSTGIFVCSFARGGRLRSELYIDSKDKDDVKHAFDRLAAARQEIEQAFGGLLSWERLDARRASRIALYKAGRITGSAEELDALMAWAADALPRLYNALRFHLKPPMAPHVGELSGGVAF